MTSHRPPWVWGPLSPLGLGAAIVTLVVDQANKWWMLAVYGIREGERVAVLPFLDLTYVVNPGVSYGLFPMHTREGQWFWAGFAVLAALGMAVWLARGVNTKLVAAGLGLIIGGALSNAVDRLYLGGVADFFQPHAFGFYWRWVFNIADMAIVAGVIGLLYDTFAPSRNRAAKST